MIIFNLLIRAVASTLILSDFDAPISCCRPANSRLSVAKNEYSKTSIKMMHTKVRLVGDELMISGLDNSTYLICTREGQLLFPNTPSDQNRTHRLKVQDGDRFTWLYFNLGPYRAFLADLFPVNAGSRMTTEDLEHYQFDAQWFFTFKVASEGQVTTWSKINGCCVSWKTWLMALLIVFFILSAVASVIVPLALYDPCKDPNTREYMPLIFYRPNESTIIDNFYQVNLEIEKDCSNPYYFNYSFYADRINRCLQVGRPDKSVSGWEIGSFTGKPFFNPANGCNDNCGVSRCDIPRP